MPKHKGIMPAFVYPPQGVPQMFMDTMHESYRAGVFQHKWACNVGSRPNAARTRNGNAFLASDAEWIFLVDTDMTWAPDAIIQLRQFAEEHNVKAVSGWALVMKQGIWPNAYRYEDGAYIPWGSIEPWSHPLRVDAVGGSNFLVHRDVYEAVAEHTRDTTEFLWQDDVYSPEIGAQMGEDITLCDRIRKFTDYEIWYHPGAIFTHVKATPYGPKEYLRFMDGLLKKLNGDIHSPNLQPAD